MAAVSRAVVCQDGDNGMTNKTNNSLTPVAQEAGGLPARTNKTPMAHQPGRGPSMRAKDAGQRAVGPGLSQVPSHKRRLLDGAAAVRRGSL